MAITKKSVSAKKAWSLVGKTTKSGKKVTSSDVAKAAKKLWISISSGKSVSGSSTTSNKKPSTSNVAWVNTSALATAVQQAKTNAQPSKPSPAPSTTNTGTVMKQPDNKIVSAAQNAYNARIAQWVPAEQAAIEITNKIKSAWYNTSWLNFTSTAKAPVTINNQWTGWLSTWGVSAAEYAAKFPGSPNPFTSDATSDIAMAWTLSQKKDDIQNRDWIITDPTKINTQQWIIQQQQAPNVDPKTWQPITDSSLDFAKQQRNEDMSFTQRQFAKEYNQLNDLRNTTDEVIKNQADIIQNRLDNAEQTYSNINTAISELKTKATEVFNQWASRQAYALARQMADQWYITNDQLASVANFAVSDYRRNADLQRAELEQEIQQKYIDAIREKQGIIDSIFQDQSLNENAKQQYAAQINSIYNSITDNLTTAYNNIQSQYQQTVQSILSPYVSTEAWAQALYTQDKVQKDLDKINYQYAFAGPLERTNFIMNYINSNVDKNLAPYVMQAVREQYKRGDFATRQDLAQQIADIVSAAQQKYTAATTAPASSWWIWSIFNTTQPAI